ncbi:16S rRNA (guanine(966)-N(2))-methyltransferase RsmD [Candidatus Schneideria nysicola]|uniref:16S rRNA (guanine(966)-N(2))-methyltransferase RsmD n=1 Tax=Candidatus Schneideria nysicola TaxID=1081631 RepID=UPI001CAA79D9|nr:16S rRNA (guanine(966)-N(2))-methyltransferase RsmD [Candidatus Schneideria nysicola]UAJ64891.1 16S rRNA (guanine(966)-N(2))-methyltransferase RsmD [Candidatus Schneideria nysicola]
MKRNIVFHRNIHFSGSIRIIGGRWKNRKIPVLSCENLRPTTSRMRETIFNWLTPKINGAHCLDCFAGSGALGLEALSRYAASVIFLEKDFHYSNQICKILQTLQIEKNIAIVVRTNTLHWMKQSNKIFDLVFIDPPFYQGLIEKTIYLLNLYRLLKRDAWIYIESEYEISYLNVPMNWRMKRKKSNSKVTYWLYQLSN